MKRNAEIGLFTKPSILNRETEIEAKPMGESYLKALMAEEYISFNIKRSEENHSSFPRQVILKNTSLFRKTVIPGINKNRENQVVKNLKEYQNWNTVKKYSFEIAPYLYSFLWRFRPPASSHQNLFGNTVALTEEDIRKIKKSYRSYQDFLTSSLSRGQVFLIPDREVTFLKPDRYKQPYSRHVLVYGKRAGQVIMIPFTRKLKWINDRVDVLFDMTFSGERLIVDGIPAVENFPYEIFKEKILCCVSKAQTISMEDFLEAVLLPIGSVSPDLLEVIGQRLKKI